MGMIAQQQRDFAAAEGWYTKSLEIKEKQGNQHGAASTYHQLGRVAQERQQSEVSGEWFVKSIVAFRQSGDQIHVETAARNFMLAYRSAPEAERTKLKAMWEAAGLGPLPSEGTAGGADEDENTTATT